MPSFFSKYVQSAKLNNWRSQRNLEKKNEAHIQWILVESTTIKWDEVVSSVLVNYSSKIDEFDPHKVQFLDLSAYLIGITKLLTWSPCFLFRRRKKDRFSWEKVCAFAEAHFNIDETLLQFPRCFFFQNSNKTDYFDLSQT